MYDPTVGRWLQLDPIGFDAGDANLQRYVGNNPTNHTDPSGMQAGVSGHLTALNKALEIMEIGGALAFHRITREWKKEAQDWAKEVRKEYGASPGVNPGLVENAARHAYWIGLITARYGPKVGQLAGDAHEAGVHLSRDHLLDVRHNAWAIELMTKEHVAFTKTWNRELSKLLNGTSMVPANAVTELQKQYAEEEWKRVETQVRESLKSKIIFELTRGWKRAKPEEGFLIISNGDPRIQQLPGWKAGIPDN